MRRRRPRKFRWNANQGSPCITTKHEERSTDMVAEEGPCTISEAFDDDADNTGPLPILPRLFVDSPRRRVLESIALERDQQDLKWGEQNHPDGTHMRWSEIRDMQRQATDDHAAAGDLTWLDILLEETYEAAAETDPVKLREELVQTGAVVAAWIEAIDRRAASDV